MGLGALCCEEGRWIELSHIASCPMMDFDICGVELSDSTSRELMSYHKTEDHFYIMYKILFINLSLHVIKVKEIKIEREKSVYNHYTCKFIFSPRRYCDSVKGFFSHLLSRAQRVTADVYALMFLCDFFNFMVVIFGFASFGVS